MNSIVRGPRRARTSVESSKTRTARHKCGVSRRRASGSPSRLSPRDPFPPPPPRCSFWGRGSTCRPYSACRYLSAVVGISHAVPFYTFHPPTRSGGPQFHWAVAGRSDIACHRFLATSTLTLVASWSHRLSTAAGACRCVFRSRFPNVRASVTGGLRGLPLPPRNSRVFFVGAFRPRSRPRSGSEAPRSRCSPPSASPWSCSFDSPAA